MKVTTTVQIDQSKVKAKIENLLDDSTMLEIQQVFAEVVDPWTPFLTGKLSGDLTIDKDGVTYNVPYAKRKYFGEVYHKEVHPLATSHWDSVAMEQGAREVLEARVKEILVRRAKELYG